MQNKDFFSLDYSFISAQNKDKKLSLFCALVEVSKPVCGNQYIHIVSHRVVNMSSDEFKFRESHLKTVR